jgi:F0F1-type ATP synthase delta subunit
MKAAHYAEALYEATTGAEEATQDRLIANLMRILEEQGHRKLLPSILREYEHLVTRRLVRERAVLRVARSDDREKLAEAISRDTERIGVDPAQCVTHIDESVVGGYAIEANGKRIDRTHKRALLELYTKLVTTA